MIEIRRILCPIDFSDHSRRALDHAVAIARCYKSTVTVLHVFAPASLAAVSAATMVPSPIALPPPDCDELLAHLKAFADKESARGVTIDAAVREGYAASEVLAHAARMQADLLVMGTHGRSGFERLLLGSVTEKVLRKASCPVMTVPTRQPEAVPAGPVLYRRILCPVDFAESSLQALKHAVSLAGEAQGQLTVLHVAHDFDYGPVLEYAGMTIADFLNERELALRRRLQELIATVPECSHGEALMTHGKPWREILRVAEERHIDLLVMGVQGHVITDLWRFGSTTQHVVREASCPVLTLRAA